MPKDLGSGQAKESAHGPYAPSQMENWKTCGYFEESESQFCVFIRDKDLFKEEGDERQNDEENWLFLDEIDQF